MHTGEHQKRRNTAIEETIRRLETSEMIRKASERLLGSSAVISKGATKKRREMFHLYEMAKSLQVASFLKP